jgi:polyisoprenoid-binding protein YceI
MRRFVATLIVLLPLAFPFLTYGATWQVDPNHSIFEFKIRHLTVSNVRGAFTKPKAVITIDDQDVTRLKVEVIIDAASINTGHTQRDDHLRGPDFFDVTKYPEITFVSKKVTRVDADRLKVAGDLSIPDYSWCDQGDNDGRGRTHPGSEGPLGQFQAWGNRNREN